MTLDTPSYYRSQVSKEVLHQHLIRTFIDVVNDVGVDINHAVQHKFAAGPLQFAAGLGPRKAQALLQALERKVCHSDSPAWCETSFHFNPQQLICIRRFLSGRARLFERGDRCCASNFQHACW
jgi:hypothetical protein